MSALTNRQKLLVYVLFIVASTVGVSFLALGRIAAIILGTLLLLVLWITRQIWSPGDNPRVRISLAMLTLLTAVANGYFRLETTTRRGISVFLLQQMGMPLSSSKFEELIPPIIAIVLICSALFFSFFAITRPASGARTPNDPMLREKSFRQKLKGFCDALRADLNAIDIETRWSAEYFVPLDADVDVVSFGRKSRRLSDLLSAIRRNRRDRLFLVLGDPGSGKSVSLRTLCIRMLDEVTDDGRVPLYINLKEWIAGRQWSRENPPTLEELQSFVLRNLESRLGFYGIDFLQLHFKRMLENGLFFVVLDSFDEIPAVLDVDDSSWLIQALSAQIEAFFFGSSESRGIIASRYFRRPRFMRQREVCTLEIRPFSEQKIAASFRKYGHVTEAQINDLFLNRPDLVPIARNPFTAGLIVDYLRDPGQSLPKTKSELYASYIMRRLRSVNDVYETLSITPEQVRSTAISIAGYMFNSKDIGLDIGTPELEAALKEFPVSKAVEILVAARIARRSGSTKARFSFVHRRFNEYFFVQHLLAVGGVATLDAIPTDSKWRDALVLYAEVCADADATRIATFCWEEMCRTAQLRERDPLAYLRYVHCLRFLSDAFYGRTEALQRFQEDLAMHMIEAISRQPDLVTKKIAVEALGLIREDDIDTAVIAALRLGNRWITETAFNACRYVAKLSEGLEERLTEFLYSFPPFEFAARYREVWFSLQLSSAMGSLKNRWMLMRGDLGLLAVSMVILFVARPSVFVTLACLFVLIQMLRVELYWVSQPRATETRSTRRMTLARAPIRELERILGSLLSWRGLRNLLFVGSFFAAALIKVTLVEHDNFYLFQRLADYEQGVTDFAVKRIGGWALVIEFALAPIFVLPVFSTLLSLRRSTILRLVASVGELFSDARAALARWIMRCTWERVRGLAIIAAILVGAVSVLCLCLWGLIFLVKLLWIYGWFRICIYTLCGLMGTLALLGLCVFPYTWLRDRACLRQQRIEPPLDRSDIEKALARFSYKSSRLGFLRALQVGGAKPLGNWTNGYPPTYGYDEVGTLLAMMEARWLGLER